jgi:hypothetical protein
MKLGYRDRVILLVACVIIIFCIGIFVFIKPKWEELQKNEKSFKDADEKWSQQLDQFNSITTKQNNINKKYEKGVEVAKEFTNSMNSIEFDRFLQEKFMNTDTHVANGLTVKGNVSFKDEGTTSIPFYYYTPSVITYPLYQLADMDDSLKKASEEKLKESTTLAKMAAQTVGSGRTSLTIKTTKQDLMNLLKSVHDYATSNHDAMIIHSVKIADYNFGMNPGEKLEISTEIEKDEDGKIKPATMKVVKVTSEKKDDAAATTTNENETETDTTKKDNKKQDTNKTPGYSDVVIDYEVYYLQEPMKPDVGPAYNPQVWDDDTWKNYVSQDGSKK